MTSTTNRISRHWFASSLLAACAALALLMLPAITRAATVTETFDSYANGTVLTTIGGGGVWGPAGVSYMVVSAGGVNGSAGISTDISGSSILNWKAQPFQWSTLATGTKVVMSLDFQSSPSGAFDDDRVGWTVDADSNTTSANQLALQLDTAGMQCYWDANRTVLNPLTSPAAIKASTWYRFSVEYTKLTATSAAIVGTLTELDSSGSPTGTPYVGTIADSSAAPYSAPAARFTSTSQWPSFKNYNVIAGNADNATFTVTLPTLLSENFDSMGTAGTAPPAGWTAGYLAGNPSRVVMSPYGGEGLAINALPPLVVSDGVFATQPTSATGYNFGSTGSSERALGNFPRTTTYGDHVMQIAVVNTTGGSLTAIDVGYAGEQWRQCQGTSSSGPEMVRFLASTTSPTTGFVNYPSLDFTAPKQGPADIALDGNLAANRVVITGTITLPSAVPAGGTFYLRWHDWNDNATYDHFLAIDDVIIRTTGTPPPPPTVALSLTGSPMAEAAGVATVTATLSASSTSEVTVNLAFAGTATLTTDYTRSGANIVIAAGSTNGSITLTAVQDTVYENPNETIVVDIDTVVNGTESGVQQVTAIITDDDPAPAITLLNESFDSMGTAGTAPPTGWTIGYLAGNPSRVVMSPYAGDGLAITAITPLIVSDGSFDDSVAHVFNFGSTGSSERALGSFPRTTTYGDHVMQIAVVNTTGGSLTSVDVSYAGEQWRQCQGASSSGPEMLRFLVSTTSPITGFSNYASLDFTAPKQAAASPYIALDGNLAANRAVITGTITFASPVPAGGTFYLRWHDWNDNATYDHFLAIDDIIVSTTAAPTPPPTVALSLTGSPMAEAAGVATVTATLSASSTSEVTVNLAFAGTATLTTDYTRSGTNIVIAAGSTNGSITLTAVQDTVYENPNETIVVDIATVVNATESGTQQVTATITDDDSAPNYRSYTGAPVTENFDGLGTNGTVITPLLGWDAGQFNPVQGNQPGPGNGIATVTDTSVVVDDGTIFLANATASIGNLGTTGSGDRALGGMPKTASGDLYHQLAIKNNSGSPITSFVLSYTGEQWASQPVTNPDSLTVWFSDNNPLSGFVTMGPTFTFTAPQLNLNTKLDGNAAANRAVISDTFTPATPIAAGNTFYIRWYDRNDAAQDHTLAIDDLTVTPQTSSQVQYVIVISVDGLGGTYLTKIFNGTATGGPYAIPNFRRLTNEGASTMSAHCDNNNWETLPNHTSIVTARPRDNSPGFIGHGWSSNGDPGVGQTIHSVKGSYVASVFDVTHDNGLRTGMYANKTKFSLFDNTATYPGGGSYNATYGALDITGVDNGRDKVDNTYINSTLGGIIVNTFIAQQKTASSNQYAFIHINEPDANGHASGWGSATWNNSVVTVDTMLGNIFKLIEQDVPAMQGKTVIILTADHGNQDNPVTGADRYMVPFYVWGPGVAAGADLYVLNASNRKVASSYPMTTYAGLQPIRNAEANNLALKLLGLGPIPGSSFGFAQDLAVTTPVTGPQPPVVTITNPVNNATFVMGAPIPVEATASDSDGTVTNVAFYADGSLLGSDAAAPYNYTWATAALGAHTLAAIAWDDTGLSSTSTVVNITVATPAAYRSYTGTPITENFDGLGTAGTSVSLLGGWNAGHFNPSIQQGTTGGSGGATVTDALTVDNGSHDPNGTPMLANFGTTGSADRALGSFARTTPAGDQFLQLAIKNDSGNPITSFTLSYRGEEWRSCNAAAQALTMWYSTDPINGFVSMSGFTFNSPNNSGSNVALDGNATGNYTLISGTYLPASPIAAGSTFYLRWYDINDNGIADDFFAVDDVVVTPTTSTAPLPPMVNITSPVNNVLFSSGASIAIQASASDADGTVTNVEFFADGGLLGSDETSPYSYTWTTPALGAHALTAVAWDSTGLSATSTVVNVTVSALTTRTAYNDCAPSASSPANTTQYRGNPDGSGPLKDFDTGALWPATLTVASSGITYGGTGGPMPNAGTDCYNVFNGKVVFDSVAYYGTWMEARFTGLDPAKNYEVVASVNRGNASYTTRTTLFTISGVDSAIQSSTTGVTVNSPTSVTFLAGYNTVNGYVARWTKIKCGADGAFTLRTDNGAGVANGYAIDGLMLRETTPTPPVVAITSPTNNATYTLGSPVRVEAEASDTDGTVGSVYFYADGILLGNEASSPYSYTWIGAGAGPHALTAVAWDNDGLTSTSTVANITVTVPAVARSFIGAPITENFDGLGTGGTSTSQLIGWDAGHFTPYLQQGTAGGNGATTVTDPLTVDDGSAGTAVPILVNLGTTGSSDRALGSFARTSPQGDQFLQLAIKNDFGIPLDSITLSYRGEEWRSSATAVQQLTVWFSNTDANNGFVPMGSAFTFSSPNNSGSGQVDGNASGNSALISGTYIPASPIAPGSTFYVRWYDINDTVADDYLAIDDVTVAGPPQAPLVTITAPTNNATVAYGAPIAIEATASDIDGTVTNVTFYADGTLLGNDATGPAYSITWSTATASLHALTAVAWDNTGLSSTSTVVNITVPAPLPPTVTITKPVNNVTFSAGASITIQASASDSDATVTNVDFYADGSLLGSGATSPYSYTWTTAAEGAHALTAVAWDSTGVSATSAVVTITASALTTRTAYNDCSSSASTPANTTQYRGNGTTSGLLKDFDTGATQPTTLTITANAVSYDGTGGPMPAAGTDAYNTFNGKVVFDDVIWYSAAFNGWWMDATFTDLDPNKEYEFATSVNRNGSGGDYASRFSKFTISDIDSATQSSTTGVTVNSPTSVTFCSGNNNVGYVARWTKIKCGADGTFKVRVEDGGGVGKGYAFDGIMLVETVAVPAPPIITSITVSVGGEFTLEGTTDGAGSLVTEKATSLVAPIVWEKIQTNAVPGGAYSITIPQGADPRAFYRVMSQ